MNVLLDKTILRSIFINLLSNAVKYSPENSEIVVQTVLTNERMIIKVCDQGIGIAPEEREHIFQRFFRALNALNIEGTGLGLHIVKKYVELMHGTVDFTSGERGTTFTVDIPLRRAEDSMRLTV